MLVTFYQSKNKAIISRYANLKIDGQCLYKDILFFDLLDMDTAQRIQTCNVPLERLFKPDNMIISQPQTFKKRSQ